MRILVHNVYWFQGSPPRWGSERVAEVPAVFDALMDLYRSLAPDILCLQEVHRADLVVEAAGRLGMRSWIHGVGGVRKDYGGAILARYEGVFRDLSSPEGAPPHERVHLRGTFALECGDLELACIHLPSNRFAGSPQGGDAARVAELERVLNAPPSPEIVVGDMNCRKDSIPYRRIEAEGYVNAGEMPVAEDSPVRKGDHVWLSPEYAQRLQRFYVVQDKGFTRTGDDGNSWRLSDHHPLVAEFR